MIRYDVTRRYAALADQPNVLISLFRRDVAGQAVDIDIHGRWVATRTNTSQCASASCHDFSPSLRRVDYRYTSRLGNHKHYVNAVKPDLRLKLTDPTPPCSGVGSRCPTGRTNAGEAYGLADCDGSATWARAMFLPTPSPSRCHLRSWCECGGDR